MSHRHLCLTTAFIFQLLSLSALAQTPRVATSILPLQMLVKAIAEPTNPPVLILPPEQSPHDHLLRPSEMRTLRNSTLVFWIGPSLEGFLVRPLAALPKTTQVISLLQRIVRPAEPLADDPHLWLDPVLTASLVEQIADAFSNIDPEHRDSYRNRAQILQHKLQRLNEKLIKTFKSIRNIPFIVYHDGYQRLAQRYGLNLVASVSRDPEHPVSLRRLQEIRRIIAKQRVSCLLSEPQFPDNNLRPLLQDGMRTGILDPLGLRLSPDRQTYGQLLVQLADDLYRCLVADNV